MVSYVPLQTQQEEIAQLSVVILLCLDSKLVMMVMLFLVMDAPLLVPSKLVSLVRPLVLLAFLSVETVFLNQMKAVMTTILLMEMAAPQLALLK